MPNFRLDDKVAIVTGGGRGIGAEICRGYAEAGAHVVPTSRTLAEVEHTADQVRQLGRRSIAVSADVSDRTSVEALALRVREEFGRIDILVNNAGISPFRAPVEDIRDGGWDKIFAVNVRGCFLCTQVIGRLMIDQGGGVIINVASILGRVPMPGLSAYSASKAAVLAFTKVTAEEWAKHNIRVNALGAGWTATKFTEVLRQNDEASGEIVSRTPMGRFADPSEMVGAAIFLASEAASFVSGEALWVSGAYR
ncbi:MAG TPA: glucose 1-dehydrogenase [Dehalococcoidia bacterium]|nr:glucose 1-dehydrogenase [Dehalococcoidia bacterium]